MQIKMLTVVVVGLEQSKGYCKINLLRSPERTIIYIVNTQ